MWNTICSIRRSCCGWIGRHKALVAVSAVAGVGLAAYWGVKKVVNEAERMTMELQQQFLDQQRLNLHVTRTREECLKTVIRFLPLLRSRIFHLVDVDTPVKELRGLKRPDSKERQFKLWEDIKVLSFTRLFVSVYALTLLNLLLYVEIHILGRYSYQEARIKAMDKNRFASLAPECEPLSTEARHKFLSSSVEYFLGEGLENLVKHIKKHVEEASKEWRVETKREVAPKDLKQLLDAIRKTIEFSEENTDIHPLQRFIILRPKSEGDDKSLENLMEQAWGVIKSPMFHQILRDSDDAAFDAAWADLVHVVYPSDVTAFSKDEEERKEGSSSSPPSSVSPRKYLESPVHTNDYPVFAKVIPQVKQLVPRVLGGQDDEPANKFVRLYHDLSSVNLFCGGIFTGMTAEQ